mgnify:CR=1 FL=1
MSEIELKNLPTEVGTHKIGKAVVAKVNDKGGKVVQFQIEGYRGFIKVWRSLLGESGVLKVEQEIPDLTIEVKEDTYQGQPVLECWMEMPKPANAGGKGGGGGYRQNPPKSPAEIHASSICGLIKSAIECGGKDWEVIATKAIDVYASGIKKVAG